MSKNNKSDDKQTKSDEKEKRRRRKRTWKLIRRWAARVGLLLIALLFVLLSLHWFPAELHYKLTETYTFTSDEAATVNLAVLLPRSGPYQIVIEPEILWPGIWELEADGRLDVARFSSQIKPGEAIKAVISYKVHLYQGTADWIGEPVRSPDLIPSGSIQSDAAPLVAQAAILQVENNDQASARNL